MSQLIKKFEKFISLNEALTDNQINRIVNEFFNRAHRSMTPSMWQKLGGTYIIDRIFKELKVRLRRDITNMEDGENTRNFSIRFIRRMRKRIMYPSIVQKLGGSYLIDRYFKQWRIILTEILDREIALNEGNASYTQEWPMNKQEIGVNQDDLADTEYYKHENKFQEVQEHMKLILKPMLLKKNPNANDQDIDKVSNSFFNLGAEKAAEVKKMVDNCKDTKQCAQEIVNKFYKYVKINFGTKDNVNNVEQDSVMTSEKFGERQFNDDNFKKHWLDMFCKVIEEKMKKGYENSAIETIEKLDDKMHQELTLQRKDGYFLNKLNYLIKKSREFDCKNVEDYLLNYKENL